MAFRVRFPFTIIEVSDIMQYSTIPRYRLKLIKDGKVRYPLDKISNSNDVATIMQSYLEDKDCEHLAVLLVDANNNFLGLHTVAIGGISGMGIAIRDCFKAAIVGRASAIICAHNHPSNDVTPSREDIAFTQKVKEAGSLLGIPLLDHVIVSSGMDKLAYSFVNSRML